MHPNRLLFHFALLLLLMAPAACGYHNPNMPSAKEQGMPVSLHAPLWPAPSSEVRLAADLHNALQDWLIQSKRIILVADAGSADYVLSGKILSVNSPGRSYDAKDSAQALRVILSLEYALLDARSGKMVWQTEKHSLEKTYAVGASTAQTETNRRNALEILNNDLAEAIYTRMYRAISRHEKGRTPTP